MQGTSSHTLIWHKWVLCSSEGRCGTVKTEQTLRESNGKVHRKHKFWLLPLWDPTLYIDKLFILNESIWIIFIKERLNSNFPNSSIKSYKLLYWKWHFNCLNAAGVPKIVKQMLLARCGMFECGKNFKGSIPEICRGCGEEDDESHRLNRCGTWKHLNLSETVDKVDFGEIYSNDINILLPVIKSIQRVWELHVGNGSMKRQGNSSWLQDIACCFLHLLCLVSFCLTPIPVSTRWPHRH